MVTHFQTTREDDRANVYRAISDPTRRAILDKLRRGPTPVNTLASEFSQSRPAISKHLRILRAAHLVKERRAGRERHYRLAAKPLRVVEDHRGNLEVALDPVGAKPGDFVVTIGVSAARIAAGNPKITTDLTIGGIIDQWDEARWRG